MKVNSAQQFVSSAKPFAYDGFLTIIAEINISLVVPYFNGESSAKFQEAVLKVSE